MEIVARFLRMLRTLQGNQLEAWMETARQSNIRELQNFVEKLRKYQQAVQARLTLSWNKCGVILQGYPGDRAIIERKESNDRAAYVT